MLTALIVFLRAFGLICRGHRAVALENLALRQQLAALTRTGKRPHRRSIDRLLWIGLAHTWRDWRHALVFVQPDTVVRWHANYSVTGGPRGHDRNEDALPIDASIRGLIEKMAAANRLWG